MTHLMWGILWGIASWVLSKYTFTPINLLIVHTVFEIWELWAGGYLDNGGERLNTPEILDTILDTIFALIGLFVFGAILK